MFILSGTRQDDNEKSLYEVRYGLGNNLRRKANDKQEFLDALTEFVQLYLAETSQVYESTSQERKEAKSKGDKEYEKKHYRQPISVDDLDDVITLVNKYGSHLVCNMLVAYGYATGGKNTVSDNNQNTDSDKGEE